jgi:trigger factor
MNITIEKLPECKASAQVEVPADVVEKERKKITRSFGSQARLPGFRSGKIPQKVLEKRFGEQIKDELGKSLIQKGCQEIARRDDLDVIGFGEVKDEVNEDDGRFTFTAEVVVKPEFELPEYKGIAVELNAVNVTDEQVDDVIINIRERFAQFVDIEDRALELGDFAIIGYQSTVDGEPLNDFAGEDVGNLAKNEEYWLKLEEDQDEDGKPGNNRFLPGFVPQLVGLSKGDKKDVEVTLPDDFGLEKLQGAKVVFATEIKGIKEQQLPKVDDELAGKIEPGKNLKELCTSIVENMVADQERQRDESKTQQILEHLSKELEFDLPAHAVSEETQRQVDSMVRRGQQQGMDDDAIMEHQEQIIGNAQSSAQSSVKNTFILQAIAEAEEISADDGDLKHEVAMMAAQSQRPVKKVVRELKDNDSLGDLQHRIVIRKTLDLLRDNAKVTEIAASPADADAEGDSKSKDKSEDSSDS